MNFSQIRDRVDKGQYDPKDAQDLLDAAVGLHIDVPAPLEDRVGKGTFTVGDLSYLVEGIDEKQSAESHQLAFAQRLAADRKAAEADAAKAFANLAAKSQAKLESELKQKWANEAIAEKVEADQKAEVAAQAAADQFKAAQQASNAHNAEKAKLASYFKSLIGQ